MGENIITMESKSKETKKLSYEELESAAQNLSMQHQNLIEKYKELYVKHQELVQSNYFVRLEWLWRIINSDKLTTSFREKCETEFMDMMTPEVPAEENKD